MAYYAQIVDDIVTDVIVVSDDIIDGAQFAHDLLGGVWVQTYIDDADKNYAGIGYTYDAERDAFIAPRPDDATGFDEDTCHWIVPRPDEA